jgi:hypothetical protein
MNARRRPKPAPLPHVTNQLYDSTLSGPVKWAFAAVFAAVWLAGPNRARRKTGLCSRDRLGYNDGREEGTRALSFTPICIFRLESPVGDLPRMSLGSRLICSSGGRIAKAVTRPGAALGAVAALYQNAFAEFRSTVGFDFRVTREESWQETRTPMRNGSGKR